MRTLSGNCGGLTPALLFLRFVPLLLVLSAAFCRAESCEPGGSFPVETVASITPSTMYAGQTYNVVIMGSFPYDIPAYPGCNLDEDFVSSDLGDLLYQDVSILMEPDSEFYSQGTFSATEITLTITIGPDAPPGTAYLFLTSDGGAGTYVTFQIACPEPTITSVMPNVWFTGQSYPITITGTGFITQDSSAASGCPVSTVGVSTGSNLSVGLKVPVSNTNVVSATEITATVTPNGVGILNRIVPYYDAAAVTVVVTNVRATGPIPGVANALGTPAVSASAPADVVGTTAIEWTSDPDGTSPIISGPSAKLPNPTAVVGQQIVLTGTPTEAQISGLPIELTISPSTWTIGDTDGPNIGGYDITPTSGSVTPTTLTGPTLTTYWVYPGTYPVTYEGCVDSQSATPALYDCTTVTATFTVTGPNGPQSVGTMSVTSDVPALTIADWAACTDDKGFQWPAGPYLIYAQGVTGSYCKSNGTAGINFNAPTGFENASDGSFVLVQMINSDVVTGGCCSWGPGLDTQYPYGSPPDTDSPPSYLPPTAISASRVFDAFMFLMWLPSATGSVPVPLGYQEWGFSATAACSGSCGTASNWTAATVGTPGPVGGFINSSSAQPSPGRISLMYGYPTWTSVSK